MEDQYFNMSHAEFREMIWTSTDGKKTKIKDLETSHLVNILNWTHDRPYQYPMSMRNSLEEEATLRIMVEFTQNHPYPSKDLESGRWVLVNPEESV